MITLTACKSWSKWENIFKALIQQIMNRGFCCTFRTVQESLKNCLVFQGIGSFQKQNYTVNNSISFWSLLHEMRSSLLLIPINGKVDVFAWADLSKLEDFWNAQRVRRIVHRKIKALPPWLNLLRPL